MRGGKAVFSGLILGVIVSSTVFTGCSLVTTDYNKYYNQTAGKVVLEDGSCIKISRKDLRTAITTYGFDEYLQQGASVEDVNEMALDFLVTRSLMINQTENLAKSENAGEILTNDEKTYLFEKVYEALESNINTYINETNEQESNQEKITEESFEKQVKLVLQDGEYKLVKLTSDKTDFENHTIWSDQDQDATSERGKNQIFEYVLAYVNNDNVKRDAYKEYLADLRKNEEQLKLSKDEQEIFKREVDRLYKIFYENLMIEKYNQQFKNNLSDVSINDILDLYESKVLADYTKYEIENTTTFIDDVKEKQGDLYYYQDDVELFYVSHILVKFDETEQETFDTLIAERDAIKNGTSNDRSLEDCQNDIDNLYNSLVSLQREKDGNDWIVQEDQGLNIDQLFEKVIDEIAPISNQDEKLERFNQLVFEFNEDDGAINSKYPYIIGIQDGQIHANWVDSFKEAGVELFDNAGGQKGELFDEVIRSDYGVHIMMYAGEVGNIFEGIDSDFNLQTSDIMILDNYKINPLKDKSMLDVLYEELYENNNSNFTALNNENLKKNVKITYYPKNY